MLDITELNDPRHNHLCCNFFIVSY